MKIGAMISAIVGLIAIISALFVVDARYLHNAEASEAFQRATASREVGDLETQRELLLLELKTLTGRDQATLDRRDYVKTRLAVIEARLSALAEQGK